MSKRRRISIVIPAYENETFLNRALNSIADQNYKDIEIIVSDDCSKNANLKKYVMNLKIKILKLISSIFIKKKIYAQYLILNLFCKKQMVFL